MIIVIMMIMVHAHSEMQPSRSSCEEAASFLVDVRHAMSLEQSTPASKITTTVT